MGGGLPAFACAIRAAKQKAAAAGGRVQGPLGAGAGPAPRGRGNRKQERSSSGLISAAFWL